MTYLSSYLSQIVSRETVELIMGYYDLLKKWNKIHNLIQSQQLVESVFVDRHLRDVFLLSDHLPKEGLILDVGSGNGLPGVILSILGHPIHLCEIDHKKVSFLKYTKTCLGLSYDVITESAYDLKGPYDAVTCRAFTALGNLIGIQKNVSRETHQEGRGDAPHQKCQGIFLKGDHVQDEIDDARIDHTFDYHIVKTPEGCILKTTL